MRLAFMLYPVSDLDLGVQRWHQWGLEVLWRPDGETVILGSQQNPRAQVMLENHATEHRLGPGPVFIVESVNRFRAEHSDVDWLLEPSEVPAGRYAAYAEPDGSTVRILDITHDLGEHDVLFRSY